MTLSQPYEINPPHFTSIISCLHEKLKYKNEKEEDFMIEEDDNKENDERTWWEENDAVAKGGHYWKKTIIERMKKMNDEGTKNKER